MLFTFLSPCVPVVPLGPGDGRSRRSRRHRSSSTRAPPRLRRGNGIALAAAAAQLTGVTCPEGPPPPRRLLSMTVHLRTCDISVPKHAASTVLRSARLALVAQRVKVNAAFADSQGPPLPWAPMVRIADARISPSVARAAALPDRIAVTTFAMRVAIPGVAPDSVAAAVTAMNRIAETCPSPNGIPNGAEFDNSVAVTIALPDRVAAARFLRGIAETSAFTDRIPGATPLRVLHGRRRDHLDARCRRHRP